jgi:radical SAM superfamily enzyme YgiQ (UPF0313 family)
MRIALIYPPPWKTAAPDEAVDHGADGPPPEYVPGDLDADFYQIPYGLLSLGAQALRAGHQVKVLNLSSYPWRTVDEVVRKLDAELWGLSCWTANRRGVALVARAIKQHHRGAHVIVGGPHATPLGREILEHHAAIDTVSLGESDDTFLEVASLVARAEPVRGVPGTLFRDESGRVVKGPPRPSIADLDVLASPQDYFATHILMTSRGCPWACTFCGAETSWGRGFRAQSIDYVLDAMERALAKLPVRMIQIKDDTFTTNKKRVVELCRRIRERNLSFFWSCDTRVDLLTEELLREMRLAGCQRLSLGVESGSQRILDAIDKKITVDEILASTALAKKVGIKVRYYMMLGNRGETAESFRETLAFLDRARPHEYIFSCLSIYPGTRDFVDAEAAGIVDRRVFFEGSFQELKVPFDASDEDTAVMNAWFADHSGLQRVHETTVDELRAILDYLGDHHAAHMDLGGALYHAGDLDGAERHVRRALELGYPCPGLAHNYLACIAKARGDIDAMMGAFTAAAKVDPQHWVLIKNVNAARAWFKHAGPERGLPLELEARHDFQLLERTIQPTLPGPLPDGWETWTDAPAPAPAEIFVKTPEMEGSKRELARAGEGREGGPKRSLKIVGEE